MGLLKKAVNQTAFAKIGFMGFQGSGKTYTASRIAKGLCDLSKKEGKPKVGFFDTETGSDFLIPYFEKEGIDFSVVKSKAFFDAVNVIKEAEAEGFDVLIIDSVTHLWKEMCDAYKTKNRRKKLTMGDWGTVKGQWAILTDLYLNCKLHVIICGRSGFEYDMEKGEDNSWEVRKTGTKMKTEGEFGYEPSLLIEMEKVRRKDDKGWINQGIILKDRSDTINGKRFDYLSFKDLKPFFDYLNIGGEHVGIDTTRNSEEMFDDPDYSYQDYKKHQQIAIEELQEVLVFANLDGNSAAAKKERTKTLKEIYGSSSKTFIEDLRPREIKEGIRKIKVAYQIGEHGDIKESEIEKQETDKAAEF